ncbi:hypothetical protein Ae201684P_001276 [Aphanomyces euteiches]|nr:hypothetical protein Ae201684P_001276 [Aphanomyces euteiches]
MQAGEDVKTERREDDEVCLICMDATGPLQNGVCYDTPDMYSVENGWRLRCGHVLCIGCLRSWIRSKLDDHTRAIECVHPYCTRVVRPCHVARILEPTWTEQWSHLVTLASTEGSSVYCPNPTCSELLQVPPERVPPLATCPLCFTDLCVVCRALWHGLLDCETYKRRVVDEENSRLLGETAQLHGWKACPACTIFVEKVSGCNHMSCRCGQEFCYNCGQARTQCRCP